MGEGHWAHRTDQALVHISWNGNPPPENQPLLRLEFSARQAGTLSSAVQLAPEGLRPEGYTSDLRVHPLRLRFDGAGEWLRVAPNPVRGEATLRYRLGGEGEVRFRLWSGEGRVVWEHTLQGVVGEGQVPLPATLFPGPGVYWLEMQTPRSRRLERLLYLR
ncbi:MAG: hypothetical protein D6765_01585 [Bacteroidetes bacterium]|nr:MAG: hypothetical protein D6765_01585 [Bacteroidota bacterium]